VKISVKASSVATMIAAYRLASETLITRCTWASRKPDHCPVGCSRAPPASQPCSPKALATPCATRSRPIPSKRRTPGVNCLKCWDYASARDLTSLPVPVADGRSRRHQDRQRGPDRVIGARRTDSSCRDGVRRQWSGRSSPRRPRHRRGQKARAPVYSGADHSRGAEDEMVEALVEEAKKIAIEGVEARLAARDQSAEAEAAADRHCFWMIGQ